MKKKKPPLIAQWIRRADTAGAVFTRAGKGAYMRIQKYAHMSRYREVEIFISVAKCIEPGWTTALLCSALPGLAWLSIPVDSMAFSISFFFLFLFLLLQVLVCVLLYKVQLSNDSNPQKAKTDWPSLSLSLAVRRGPRSQRDPTRNNPTQCNGTRQSVQTYSPPSRFLFLLSFLSLSFLGRYCMYAFIREFVQLGFGSHTLLCE